MNCKISILPLHLHRPLQRTTQFTVSPPLSWWLCGEINRKTKKRANDRSQEGGQPVGGNIRWHINTTKQARLSSWRDSREAKGRPYKDSSFKGCREYRLEQSTTIYFVFCRVDNIYRRWNFRLARGCVGYHCIINIQFTYHLIEGRREVSQQRVQYYVEHK